MQNKLELMNELISQAQDIEYKNNKLDSVNKRASMLIRKIFGENSIYLNDIKNIRYHPVMWSPDTSDRVFSDSFYDGKDELLNLLNVIVEDIKLDQTINSNISSKEKIPMNSKNVFIVHGHNEEMKNSVARVVEKLGLNPIILHEQPNKGKTIIEKFTENSDVAFSIVLLSADDIAYSYKSSTDIKKFRARQNVIFELGYFIGKLGRERVLSLYQPVEEFEIPSDYSGVLFVEYDSSGKWQLDLVRELKELKIEVDANDIL